MDDFRAFSTPVKTGSVVQLVVSRIEEAIVNRELKPGDFLPSEPELVKSLGVGKSSIREAVKMLEALGVVEIKRGEGTRLCEKISADSINPLIFSLLLESGTNQDIFNLRMMFEPAYTIMAMYNANSEDIKAILSSIMQFEKKLNHGIQMVDDDLCFHRAILNSTHNPYVIKIGNVILKLFKASIMKAVKTIPDTAIKDHKRIFEAFCLKDEEKLRIAIKESFDGWKSTLEIS